MSQLETTHPANPRPTGPPPPDPTRPNPVILPRPKGSSSGPTTPDPVVPPPPPRPPQTPKWEPSDRPLGYVTVHLAVLCVVLVAMILLVVAGRGLR